MDKDVMGKNFNKTAVDIAAVMLAVFILLSVREAYPAYREAELFDLGYEQYLSSQPEKAVDAFTLFLREFPKSSAKDAAMFWMGKSFLRMKHIQEARNIFDEMAREFPESPLKSHAMREMENLGESSATKESEPVVRESYEGEERLARKPEERKETAKLLENGSAGTHAEDGIPKSGAQEEKEDLGGTHMEVLPRQEEVVVRKSAEPLAPATDRTAFMVQVAALDSEVNAFIDQYTQAYELGDIDQFMSFYSKSAIENNSLRYDEIRNGYQKNFRVSRYAYSLRDPLIEENDGNVILTGAYFIKRIQGGPLDIIAQGHIRWTLTRENGALKILRADYDQL
jgi:tetratricopeptide (TPR) repeat protein